jgi:hypothetical protein
MRNFEFAVRKEGGYGTIYEGEREINDKCSGNRRHMSSEEETYSTQLLCPGGIWTWNLQNARLTYLAN